MINRRDILKGLGMIGMGSLIAPTERSWGEDCPASPSTAIFYAKPIPDELLSRYDRLIIEADAITDDRIISNGQAEPFLYVSIGEAEPWRAGYETIDPDWFLGHNDAWGGNIVDLTKPGWQDYLLNSRIAPLWSRGYRGFFLDTLDSFRALPLTVDELARQEAGLLQILRSIYSQFSGVQIVFNRGFDLLPEFGHLAVGVVAESLFFGWSSASKSYFRLTPTDHAWLLAKLETARDTYGLPVTVIDYLPMTSRALLYRTASMIRDLGFTPYIATPELNTVGIGLPDIPCG